MTEETRWTGQVIVWALCAGLLGHLAEELREPIGFRMAGAAEEAIEYER